MSILRLVHRSTGHTSREMPVPDGEHEWAILIDNCDACGNIYNVEKTTDRFCSTECESNYRNKARRKNPERPYRKRRAG